MAKLILKSIGFFLVTSMLFLYGGISTAKDDACSQVLTNDIAGKTGDEPKPAASSILDAQLKLFNRSNDLAKAVVIHIDGLFENKKYSVFAGESQPIYEGADLLAAADAIDAYSKNADVVFASFEGLPVGKQLQIQATFKIRWAAVKGKADLRIIDGNPREDFQVFASDFFSTKYKIEKVSDPVLVSTGEQRGWFKIVLSFVREVGGKVQRCFLELFFKSEANSDAARLILRDLYTQNRQPDQNAALVLVHLVSDLRKKYPQMRPEDIQARFVDQFGNNTLALLDKLIEEYVSAT
ncbi:hypothetical protein [Paraburkholderia sp. BR10882]|uniref:hypothetical protein n=1 Tax=unclassified Paraburkholderia TaxID=2615204 RepID=UPI0034CD1EF5